MDEKNPEFDALMRRLVRVPKAEITGAESKPTKKKPAPKKRKRASGKGR